MISDCRIRGAKKNTSNRTSRILKNWNGGKKTGRNRYAFLFDSKRCALRSFSGIFPFAAAFLKMKATSIISIGANAPPPRPHRHGTGWRPGKELRRRSSCGQGLPSRGSSPSSLETNLLRIFFDKIANFGGDIFFFFVSTNGVTNDE